MDASTPTQSVVEKPTDYYRQVDHCSVCGEQYGRIERVVDSDGKPGRKHWHTDLPDSQEYCVEWCNGAAQKVSVGKNSNKVTE